MSMFKYDCDEVKKIIDEVSPNYPQLTTFEKEWLYFNKYGYIPGIPVNLEYATVETSDRATVLNTIPYSYKSAILKGNTKYRDIDTGDILDTFDETKNLELVSVKVPVLTTTGKNLFDMKDIDKDDFEPSKYQSAYYGKEFILESNTKYTIKAYLREDITDTSVWTVFNIINNNSILEVINIDKTGIGGNNEIKQVTFTTDSTGKVGYSIYSHNKSERSWLGNLPFDIQLEKGSTATSYEPYKSNILTVNEDVTLRSNGDVYDELNLLTGRLTQRIDENNEILSQEVVKTVDLSVVNQEGNSTQLKPFDGITHITVSSDELNPKARLEIPIVSTGDMTLLDIQNQD